MNKVQKKVEEQAQRLKERQEQCTQLEASLKESKDKLLAFEQRVEQLEGLNKVCDESLLSAWYCTHNLSLGQIKPEFCPS